MNKTIKNIKNGVAINVRALILPDDFFTALFTIIRLNTTISKDCKIHRTSPCTNLLQDSKPPSNLSPR